MEIPALCGGGIHLVVVVLAAGTAERGAVGHILNGVMSSSEDPRLEKPLQSRQRLAMPRVPEGEPATRFANMALGLYATLCNVVGLVFTLTGAFMSEWLGVSGTILTIFGVAVLLWSFMVTLYANRRVSRRREVQKVIKINVVLMVLALVSIVLSGGMTSDGRALFGLLTLATAGFTAAQYSASRTLS